MNFRIISRIMDQKRAPMLAKNVEALQMSSVQSMRSDHHLDSVWRVHVTAPRLGQHPQPHPQHRSISQSHSRLEYPTSRLSWPDLVRSPTFVNRSCLRALRSKENHYLAGQRSQETFIVVSLCGRDSHHP